MAIVAFLSKNSYPSIEKVEVFNSTLFLIAELLVISSFLPVQAHNNNILTNIHNNFFIQTLP